jgi:hypothetical protein
MKGVGRMADQKYNGWTNRATWNVALWLGNDEPLYRWAVQTVRRYQKEGKAFTASAAREFCTQAFGEKTPDGNRVASANFTEIANAMKEMAGE